MKVKLDEGLSSPLLKVRLEALGHDVETVVDEALSGQPDIRVLAAASAEARLLFTIDPHLADKRVFPIGSHAGVVLFRLPNPLKREIVDFVVANIQSNPVNDWPGMLVIVRPSSCRVIKN